MQRTCALYAGTLAAALFMAAPVAAVPTVVAHQGRLLDSQDQPVSGSHTFTVRLFGDATGGSPLWSEVHTAVQVTDGLYELALGSVTPLSAELLSPPSGAGLPPAERYLEIEVDADGPMSPRVQLLSTPYSVAAARLSGDVETAPGELRAGTRLIVSNIGSSGLDGVRASVDPGGDSHLSVANIGSSGQDGVRMDVDGTGKSGLTVSNIGSSGQDGVSITADATTRKLVVSNIGSSGQDGVRMDVDGTGKSGLTVSNIGSSGQDGVSITADATTRKLVVSNIGSSGQDGVEVRVDGSGRSLAVGNIGSSGEDGVRLTVDPAGHSSVAVSNIGSSGQDGVSIVVDGLTSSMAINQKGTGADKNRTGGTASDTGAVLYVEHDDDGDGIAENSVVSSSSATHSRLAIKTKGTGAHRLSAGGDCDDTDASLHADFDVDGDGLPDVAILEACTVDSVSSTISFSYPNAAAPTSVSGAKCGGKQKAWLCSNFRLSSTSETVVDVSCDSATAGSVWSADDLSGLAATTLSIRASVDPSVNPIEHSSGAVLTPGGVWTNASDENLKENFASVDGEDLLRKIDRLPIREWNYKNEPDQVKHIGPTAQDFQAAFGVGGNDKTISTIDPSGIALAALKELHRQNQELRASNGRLQEQLDALREAVRELQKR